MSLLTDTQGTPERVWSAISAVAAEGGSLKRDDLWRWLNPPFVSGGHPRPSDVSAPKQAVGAAASLGLLSQEGSEYALTSALPAHYAGFSDLVHDRLVALGPDDPDYLVLEAFAWIAFEVDRLGTEYPATNFADAADHALKDASAGEEARRFNSTKLAAWRRWIRFLGLATSLPSGPGFYPCVTERVGRELHRYGLKTGVPLPVNEVLDALALRTPYLDRGTLRSTVAARAGLADDASRVSRLLSSALRDLHDEGRLVLHSRGDAAGYVTLFPDSFHGVQSVLAVTIVESEDD